MSRRYDPPTPEVWAVAKTVPCPEQACRRPAGAICTDGYGRVARTPHAARMAAARPRPVTEWSAAEHAESMACPQCGAAPGTRCRSASGRRAPTHSTRAALGRDARLAACGIGPRVDAATSGGL